MPQRQDNPDRAEILLRGPGTAWWRDENGTPITRRSRTAQLRSLCVLLDDLLDFREQASAHLLYHQWMLRESLDAALSYRVRNRAFLKQRINGLGAPADRLRALRLALNVPG